jgi:RHS repeat-associated protein
VDLKYWNILKPGGEVIGRVGSGGSSRRYYLKDHLGSIRAVLDGGGGVRETRDYYPFGLPMPGRYEKGSPPTQEDYTGHVKDEATGLHYAGARYYSGAFGRWTATEPLLQSKSPKKLLKDGKGRLLSGSPYGYSFNNPATLRDPTGNFPCGGVCTGAALVIGTSTVAGAVGGAATSAAIQGVTKGSVDLGQVGTAALKGGAVGLGVSGGTLLGAGTAVGAAASGVLGGGVAGGGSEIVEGIISGESPGETQVDVALGTLAGGGGAFVGGKAGSAVLKRSLSPKARVGLVDMLAKNLSKFKNTKKALKLTLEESLGAAAAKRITGSLFGGSSKELLEKGAGAIDRRVDEESSGSNSESVGCPVVRKSCQ